MNNKQLILIDTSAWILYLRGTASSALRQLISEALSFDLATTSEMIIFEILRGAKTERMFHALWADFKALKFLPAREETWEKAYKLGFNLGRQGYNVPSPDILIAALSIQNNCLLVHTDKHFNLISKTERLQAEYLN